MDDSSIIEPLRNPLTTLSFIINQVMICPSKEDHSLTDQRTTQLQKIYYQSLFYLL